MLLLAAPTGESMLSAPVETMPWGEGNILARREERLAYIKRRWAEIQAAKLAPTDEGDGDEDEGDIVFVGVEDADDE